MQFVLKIDVPGHDHSPRNHRHEIGTALDHVKQQIGSTETVEGIITRAGNVPIGTWKLTAEEPH